MVIIFSTIVILNRSILFLLLLWCFISSLVVLRYKTRSRMSYSFVYRSGPRSLGVVPNRGDPSTLLGTEGHDGTAAEEDGIGIRPTQSANSARRESGLNPGVQGGDVVNEDNVFENDGGMQRSHKEDRECLVHKEKVGNERRSGKGSQISEPPVPSTDGPGETSSQTLPVHAPGGSAGAMEGTFAPPSHELLRSAFRYRPGELMSLLNVKDVLLLL